MPKVRAHTRKLASGKLVHVREHMVSGVRGYHHPDTQKRAANAKDQKKFHENEAKKHRERYAYLQGQLSPLSGKEYSQAERDRIENAANWHYYQSEAHSARAYQMRGDLSDTGKVLARDGVKHSEKYAAKPPTRRERKKAMSINSTESPDMLDLLKSKISEDAELLEKSRVKAHTRTTQSGKKVIVREYVDSRTKSQKKEAHQRHLKSGKVVNVREHEIDGVTGFHHSEVKPFSNKPSAVHAYHSNRAKIHAQASANHSVKAQKHKEGSPEWKEHKAAQRWHDAQEDAHLYQAIPEKHRDKFYNKDRKESEKYAKQGHEYHKKHSVGKSMVSELLQAAIDRDANELSKAAETLNKGITYKKTVKEMKVALENKVKQLQIEYATQSGIFQERLKQAQEQIANYQKEHPEEQPPGETDFPAESWQMRDISRQLERCNTALRNLRPSDIIELNERELAEYGF